MRTPDGQALSWATGADVEALTWLPDQPTQFLVSTEDGLVAAFDARKGGGACATYPARPGLSTWGFPYPATDPCCIFRAVRGCMTYGNNGKSRSGGWN